MLIVNPFWQCEQNVANLFSFYVIDIDVFVNNHFGTDKSSRKTITSGAYRKITSLPDYCYWSCWWLCLHYGCLLPIHWLMWHHRHSSCCHQHCGDQYDPMEKQFFRGIIELNWCTFWSILWPNQSWLEEIHQCRYSYRVVVEFSL